MLRIAILNLRGRGIQFAGSDPNYRNLSSGIHSIMSQKELLSVQINFPLTHKHSFEMDC